LGLAAWIQLTNIRNHVTVDDIIGDLAVAPALARHKERMYEAQLIKVGNKYTFPHLYCIVLYCIYTFI